jgi:xylulokinase
VAGFADATGAFLPLVCTLNATKVTDSLAALLGVDHAIWDQLALDGTSAGLTLLPWFDGERTPDRPDATGVLSGLRPDVSPAQLARAAVEGVLCGLLDGVDARESAVGPAAGRRVLTGGGARSAAYRQVLADLSGQSWTAVADEEFVARGAALQAAAITNRTTVGAQLEAWPAPAGQVVEPSSATKYGAEASAAVRVAYAQLRSAF